MSSNQAQEVLPPQTATPSTTTVAQSSPSTASKRRNKRKKKKRNSTSTPSSDDGQGGSDINITNTTTILHSKLSIKKRAFLKKSAKLTPWYDANELIDVGRGLLLALKLFPPPSSSSPGHNPRRQHDGDDDDDDAVPTGLTRNEPIVSAHRSIVHRPSRRPLEGTVRSRRTATPRVDVTAGLAGSSNVPISPPAHGIPWRATLS